MYRSPRAYHNRWLAAFPVAWGTVPGPLWPQTWSLAHTWITQQPSSNWTAPFPVPHGGPVTCRTAPPFGKGPTDLSANLTPSPAPCQTQPHYKPGYTCLAWAFSPECDLWRPRHIPTGELGTTTALSSRAFLPPGAPLGGSHRHQHLQEAGRAAGPPWRWRGTAG